LHAGALTLGGQTHRAGAADASRVRRGST
jgi:hypothetical protein